MPKKEFSLPRSKMIKGKIHFSKLAKEGKKLLNFPILAISSNNTIKPEVGNLVAFSVGKKRFKRAVDRVKIKRLMRESYRLNQTLLSNNPPKLYLFVYVDSNIPTLEKLHKAFMDLINKLNTFETKH